MFYLLKDDNDRANYYVDNSYQQFIRVFPCLFMNQLLYVLSQDWSNLNSLLSSTHHSRLHSLQKLREMKEYLQFVTKKGTYKVCVYKNVCAHFFNVLLLTFLGSQVNVTFFLNFPEFM